jgi:hypothetical protein
MLANVVMKRNVEGAQMTKDKQVEKSKGEKEKQLSKELESTFPASDPPSSTQPGGGITGPEVAQPPSKTK